MDPKELEKKIEELTRQLEKEKAEKEFLEKKASQKPLEGVKTTVLKWVNRLRKSFEPVPKGRRTTEETRAPVLAAKKTVLEESVADDLQTYRNKLATYDLHQLEDIYLHLDREAFPDRFAALVEELRRRPPS